MNPGELVGASGLPCLHPGIVPAIEAVTSLMFFSPFHISAIIMPKLKLLEMSCAIELREKCLNPKSTPEIVLNVLESLKNEVVHIAPTRLLYDNFT